MTTTKQQQEKAQLREHALPVGSTVLTGKSGRKYKILEVLGAGGFGITYKAVAEVKLENGMTASMFFAIKEHFMKGCYRDTDRTRVLCPPTLKGDVEQSREDFRTEAERLMKLNGQSPNIVKVNEWFDANGTRYYAMEYLDGQTLEQYVGGRPLPEAKALSLLLPVARAVELVHKERLLHLDIKPDNIVLKTDLVSGAVFPVLIDFGLAKHFDGKGRPTSHLVAKGATEGYAPMEQYAEIDHFAPEIDVYALGATLFYLLTGKNPPKAFDMEAVTSLPGKLPADVSPCVRQAIAGAMQPSRHDRMQTVAEFVVMLEGINRLSVLPLNYLLRGNKADYLITEVVRFTPTYIVYKARQNHVQVGHSSVMATKGEATRVWEICYVYERSAVDTVVVTDTEGELVDTFFMDSKRYDVYCVVLQPSRLKRWVEEINKVLSTSLKQPKSLLFLLAIVLLCFAGVYVFSKYFLSEPDYASLTVEELNKYAEQGKAKAQTLLGVRYEEGDGVSQSDEMAAYWYTKAAEQGDAVAQFHLGVCYEVGDGVPDSEEMAAYWYAKAAEQNYAPAQNSLGDCYYFGDGVSEDEEMAVEWWTKAAEQGYAEAQYNLGDCYYEGDGVSQNYETAVQWYTKAAEQGYVEAQNSLGDCYYDGKGVLQDNVAAMQWYAKAAEQGDKWGQWNLGLCYYYGKGVVEDEETAVQWFTKSAKQGCFLAQYFLGNCYYEGHGVPQNYEVAVQWLTKAAEQNYAPAQFSLGVCYYKGYGVRKNQETAVQWFTKAAALGDADAKSVLENLKNINTSEIDKN